MTGLVPGIAHRFQFCQDFDFLQEARVISTDRIQAGTVSLRGSWYHHGCSWHHPGCSRYRRGCSWCHRGYPWFDRTLLVVPESSWAFSKDHSRASSSYSVIGDVRHLPARVLSSNTSAITGRVTGVVECGARGGGGRGSERSGIPLRCEILYQLWRRCRSRIRTEGHSEGGWSS